MTNPSPLVVRNINGRDVITNEVVPADIDKDPAYVMLQGHFGPHGAHCFKAAPVMLEALRAAEDEIERLRPTTSVFAAHTAGVLFKIRAAIAAAEGGE